MLQASARLLSKMEDSGVSAWKKTCGQQRLKGVVEIVYAFIQKTYTVCSHHSSAVRYLNTDNEVLRFFRHAEKSFYAELYQALLIPVDR